MNVLNLCLAIWMFHNFLFLSKNTPHKHFIIKTLAHNLTTNKTSCLSGKNAFFVFRILHVSAWKLDILTKWFCVFPQPSSKWHNNISFRPQILPSRFLPVRNSLIKLTHNETNWKLLTISKFMNSFLHFVLHIPFQKNENYSQMTYKCYKFAVPTFWLSGSKSVARVA